MGSEKRASEGIFLLSMYGDEDDEMEALDEQEEENRFGMEPVPPSLDDVAAIDDDADYQDIHVNAEHLDARVSPLQKHQFLRSEFESFNVRKTRTTIVDYGQEEGAMSPEAEDEETRAAALGFHEEQRQNADGKPFLIKSPRIAPLSASGVQITTPQALDHDDVPVVDALENNLDSAPTDDVAMVSDEDKKDVDLLDKFLPPATQAKCSQEVQDKIIKFIALKKSTGRNFNSEVRNRKEYRNPDFLLHAMTYQKIDQIGSCFTKDVFDPHGYDKSDFYDELETDMRKEMERKEQERKKSQKIDFSSAGVQAVNVVPTPKIALPTPTSNFPLANPEYRARDGRQNKKSKWDKVDPDPKEHENIHTSILPSAGGGYAAFARQKRRDSEERQSMDKKLDKRS